MIQDSTQWRCSQQYVKINYSFAISDTGNNNLGVFGGGSDSGDDGGCRGVGDGCELIQV